MLKRLAVLSVFFASTTCMGSSSTDISSSSDFLKSLKPRCLNLSVEAQNSIEEDGFSGLGTAWWISKNVAVTNQHLSVPYHPSKIKATDYEGREISFNVIYVHPHFDFGFLKVSDGTKVKVSAPKFNTKPVIGDDMYLLGNDSGNNFSFLKGRLTGLNEQVFGQHTYRATLNSRGGSSGSPWFNKNGEIIGVNAMGNENTGYAIPIQYVLDTWNNLKKGNTLPHYSLGYSLGMSAIGEYLKSGGFPKSIYSRHKKFLQSSDGKVLVVENAGGKKKSDLMSGDIVWGLNGKVIGGDWIKLYNILKASEEVNLKIFRAGKGFLDFNNISVEKEQPLGHFKALSFANAMIFEEDDERRRLFSPSENKLYIGFVNSPSLWRKHLARSTIDIDLESGGVNPVYDRVISINGESVRSISDLLKVLKGLKKQKIPVVTEDTSGKQRFSFIEISSIDNLDLWERKGSFDPKEGFFWSKTSLSSLFSAFSAKERISPQDLLAQLLGGKVPTSPEETVEILDFGDDSDDEEETATESSKAAVKSRRSKRIRKNSDPLGWMEPPRKRKRS